MTTENYYPIPPTKTQKAIICLPEEVQAWKDENQKLSTWVEELGAQVTALKKIAEEERAYILSANVMESIGVDEFLRTEARRQLAKEHPEAFR